MDWISVEDHLPTFEKKVLAYDTQRICIAFRPTEDEYNEHWQVALGQDDWPWGCTGAVTHWMPLPKVPED